LQRNLGKYDRATDQRTYLIVSSFQSESITVLVGLPSKAFTVEKSVLLTSSAFFENSLAKQDKKAAPNEVKLPDNTAQAFDIYLAWLQNGCFYIVEEEQVDHSLKRKNLVLGLTPESIKWDECYKLGHSLQDCDFRDACIDWAQEKMISDKKADKYLHRAIYATRIVRLPHRKFAVDVATYLWDESMFDDTPFSYTQPKFHRDLLNYMGKETRSGTLLQVKDFEKFFKDAGCKYHEHVALDKPCYKKIHRAYK
jgi:hypothetical protein